MNKKTIIISIGLMLVLIIAMIATPAIVSSKKENAAVEALNELYNEDFVMTKSTAGKHFLKTEFEATVQSQTTQSTYDFSVKDDTYTGNYYGENINIELNKLLEQHVDGVVMTNTHVQVDEPTPLKEAQVEQVDVKILTNKPIEKGKIDALAEVVKQELGNVEMDVELFVVEREDIYEGVKKEIVMYFQLSTISSNSFEDFPYQTEKYKY